MTHGVRFTSACYGCDWLQGFQTRAAWGKAFQCIEVAVECEDSLQVPGAQETVCEEQQCAQSALYCSVQEERKTCMEI